MLNGTDSFDCLAKNACYFEIETSGSFGDSILSFDPISVLPNKSFYTTNEVGLITSLFLLQYYLQFRYQRKGGQSNISSLLKEEDEFGKLLFFFNPD